MTRNTWKCIVWVVVLAALPAYDAAAWGPRAQRAVTGTAIQMIRRTYPNAFKTVENTYEEDVLRGSVAGPEQLNHGKPFPNEKEALSAVDNEITLLREVRQHGMGSYFSYRMGILASLVADLILPYALDTLPANTDLKEQIQADIDAHLAGYGFTPTAVTRQYMRNAREYYVNRRTFYADNRRMIADDYRRGQGYEGFLREGGQAFFGRSVEAVADVWHTVLRIEGGPSDIPPSPSIVTWYLVDEIRYLLEEKQNFHQATYTYDHFEAVNPGIIPAIEKVGDLFYGFGTEQAANRGVREWRLAYQDPGPYRRHISEKLANHYIGVGERYLDKAAGRDSEDDDLSNALHAFNQALEFDQGNEDAAMRVNETNAAIAERKERHDLNINIIAAAEKVMVKAEKSAISGDYGNAIATYEQASELFKGIDEEFPDLQTTAHEGVKNITYDIDRIINELFRAAEDAVDKGDRFKSSKQFDDAMNAYRAVADIVSVIPGDETTTHGKDKREIVETANKRIQEAKEGKMRWEDRQRQQEDAAKKAAGAK